MLRTNLLCSVFLVSATVLAACFRSPAPPAATSPRPPPVHVDDVAVVFVIQGLGIWMGNDEYPHPGVDTYPGAFRAAVTAIDATVAQLPPASRLAVITYALNAQLRMPLRRAARTASRHLGTQQEYEANLGSDLARGVEAGLRLLAHARASRKLLLVLGDGQDNDPDVTRPQLATMRGWATRHAIEVAAVVLPTPFGMERELDIPLVTDDVIRIDAPSALVDEVRAIIRRTSRRATPAITAR